MVEMRTVEAIGAVIFVDAYVGVIASNIGPRRWAVTIWVEIWTMAESSLRKMGDFVSVSTVFSDIQGYGLLGGKMNTCN